MTTIIGYYRGFSVTQSGDTAYVRSPDDQIVGAFAAHDDSLKAIEELVDTREDAEPKEGSGWYCPSCHAEDGLRRALWWVVPFAIAAAASLWLALSEGWLP